MEENEKLLILHALKQARGNKTQAAKILNIQRSVLYKKMDRLSI
jgi:transcriptional regulator with PAS, ATPase and Fis domain